jgi:hypothetical protein
MLINIKFKLKFKLFIIIVIKLKRLKICHFLFILLTFIVDMQVNKLFESNLRTSANSFCDDEPR